MADYWSLPQNLQNQQTTTTAPAPAPQPQISVFMPTGPIATNDVQWLIEESQYLAYLESGAPNAPTLSRPRLVADGAKLGEIANRYDAIIKNAEALRLSNEQLRGQLTQAQAQIAAQAAAPAQTVVVPGGGGNQQPATVVTPVVVTPPKTGISGTTLVLAVGLLAVVGGGAWWLSRRPGGISGALTGKGAVREYPRLAAAEENPVHRVRRGRRSRRAR